MAELGPAYEFPTNGDACTVGVGTDDPRARHAWVEVRPSHKKCSLAFEWSDENLQGGMMLGLPMWDHQRDF